MKTETAQELPTFDPGKVDPGTAPKPEQQSRKKSQAQAAAMEAQAGSMSQMACMMMMNNAMKMPAGEEKNSALALAAMQCNQASQTLMQAAKNKRESEDMEKADPGKPATMELGKFKVPEQNKEESVAQTGSVTSTGPDPVAPDSPSVDAPKIPDFRKPVAEAPNASPTPPPPAQLVELGTIPNSIERAKIGYDETGKSGAGLTPERSLGLGSSVSTAKPGDTAIAEKGGGNITALAKTRRAKSEIDLGAMGSSSGGESDSASDSSSNPLDAMMAMLTGGAAGEGGTEEGGGNGEIAALGAAAQKAKPNPNIFEYATFRYRRVTFEEGRVRSHPQKQANLLNMPILAREAGTTR